MPTPRRRPWGHLWAAAPWDGKARPPEPVRAPLTEAGLIDTPPPRGTLSLRRRPWGRLFATAPWAARPAAPAASSPPPEPTPVTMTDLLLAFQPPPDEPPAAAADDRGGVDFNFEPADDAGTTARLTPPSEVLS